MSLFPYFAYGSNLLTSRLADRCPSARYHAVACVDGLEIEFSKEDSEDESGKATLVPSHGHRLYGVVYEVELSELEILNGVESGYDLKHDFKVTRLDTDTPLTVKTYIAPEQSRKPGLKPFDWYLALIVAGAIEHGFPQAEISAYQNMDFQADKEGENKSNALRLLRQAGFESIEQVLNRKRSVAVFS
ncbi:MAG: gamma-glutamylcyclotransferase [Gammaproteobacteria bacterium]|nr:gamma-glutamylcyclotransferase [Gammaproteobacteria bacterium]